MNKTYKSTKQLQKEQADNETLLWKKQKTIFDQGNIKKWNFYIENIKIHNKKFGI